MGKVVKGKDAPEKSGPAVGYAAGLKRLERNRARREQRAKAKRAKQRAAAKQLGVPSPVPDEIALKSAGAYSVVEGEPTPLVTGQNKLLSDTDGCAALPPMPAGPSDMVGKIHGSPRMDPDFRLGRRSVPAQWEAIKVYDLRIVRATDNAITMVKGLSQQKAEELMLELARFNTDLVSVERSPRFEYS